MLSVILGEENLWLKKIHPDFPQFSEDVSALIQEASSLLNELVEQLQEVLLDL